MMPATTASQRRRAPDTMIHIRDIDHLVLRVTDLPAMLRFYCDGLGCHVERRQDEIGLVQLRAGRAMLDLVPVDGKLGRAGGAAPGAEGHNVDHFCLRVQPFDEAAIRSHLASLGIEAGPHRLALRSRGRGAVPLPERPAGQHRRTQGPVGGASGRRRRRNVNSCVPCAPIRLLER